MAEASFAGHVFNSTPRHAMVGMREAGLDRHRRCRGECFPAGHLQVGQLSPSEPSSRRMKAEVRGPADCLQPMIQPQVEMPRGRRGMMHGPRPSPPQEEPVWNHRRHFVQPVSLHDSKEAEECHRRHFPQPMGSPAPPEEPFDRHKRHYHWLPHGWQAEFVGRRPVAHQKLVPLGSPGWT
mmetsp:Transcript_29961/g.54584  ORF Transcript_29961/g.54584 Transcript_29961/m.54584 type:complete len:180 (-) Transcript_29961:31-570(-)